MTIFQTIAVLLVLAAVGGYVNHRYVRLPVTIGQMAFALIVSLLGALLGMAGWLDLSAATEFVQGIDFADVLLHGMLSFLLFAGAMHVNLSDLKNVMAPVSVLATFGVCLATALTGTLVFHAAQWVGIGLPFIYALLFGALISPTDPIAVLAMLKQAGASRGIYAKIAGESLFNDGVGVVVFLSILGVATGARHEASAGAVAAMLAQEALGGLSLGVLLGWAAYRLLRSIDEYKVELLITLALAAGGYALAEVLHVSAPICMVAAGLVVGNQGRALGMSDKTRARIDDFWELVDEVLNAVLFMLIGLEIIVLAVTRQHIALGLMAIVAVLLARAISVGLPLAILGGRRRFEKGTVGILTWGGLRGGVDLSMVNKNQPWRARSRCVPP